VFILHLSLEKCRSLTVSETAASFPIAAMGHPGRQGQMLANANAGTLAPMAAIKAFLFHSGQ
jgi:hypothetical protein